MQAAVLRRSILLSQTPQQSGALQIQFNGKKKFRPIWLDLAKGVLTMKEPKGERGGDVLRTANVAGCAVGDLKNSRKGHAHAFRLDLKEKDSAGAAKHVLSFDVRPSPSVFYLLRADCGI